MCKVCGDAVKSEWFLGMTLVRTHAEGSASAATTSVVGAAATVLMHAALKEY